MLFAEDLARVGWRCLHFAPGADLTDDLRRGLAAQDITLFEMDAGAIGSKGELMRALAAALKFPDYFGHNWDAVAECLRDLPDRTPGDGYVLFLLDGLNLWRAAPELAGALVETWLSAAEDAGHDDIGLHLVFLGPAPQG
ncbi:MAG: barstar family protein [Dongiaceae bacterium]